MKRIEPRLEELYRERSTIIEAIRRNVPDEAVRRQLTVLMMLSVEIGEVGLLSRIVRGEGLLTE